MFSTIHAFKPNVYINVAFFQNGAIQTRKHRIVSWWSYLVVTTTPFAIAPSQRKHDSMRIRRFIRCNRPRAFTSAQALYNENVGLPSHCESTASGIHRRRNQQSHVNWPNQLPLILHVKSFAFISNSRRNTSFSSEYIELRGPQWRRYAVTRVPRRARLTFWWRSSRCASSR